jgi:outer membrane receptor protein involved in Fe transport
MRLFSVLPVLAVLVLLPGSLRAQVSAGGTVTGIVTDRSTRAPLENANVVLRSRADSTRVLGTTSGKDGGFTFARVPLGAYVVECSLIGHTSTRSPEFVLSPASPSADLRTLALRPSALMLDEVVIRSERSLFSHNIDRRVYNVSSDLMARSSTASDILQNIPSVQVDIDGNVSLRGSTDVMVLVNGKKSPLMGSTRADVLQQLPAATIDKIEVITNPSARFTPEGTSGIINIVMKKGAAAGLSGDVTGHLGAAGRHNENVSLGYNPGKLSLFGKYGYRKDSRRRMGTDERTFSATGPTQSYREDNAVTMRPRVHMGNAGLSYRPDPNNALELSAEYFRRRPAQDGLATIVTRGAGSAVLTDFDRRETGGEAESEAGATASFEHDFAKDAHNLRLEANLSDSPEDEDSHFVEYWRTPARPNPEGNVLTRRKDRQGRLSLDYTNPVNDDSKLEAGYALELQREDLRSDADSLDVAQGTYRVDANRTYRFQLDQAIHAVYGTWEQSLGKFSALGGLRAEYATVTSDLVSRAERIDHTYSGLYPSLHLSFQASERGQVQLNYSRRIRRPEGHDLNPFPEYSNPYNVEEGNPRLRPESIHSLELGYRMRGDNFSFVPSIYYRYKRDGFTRLTTALNDSTFLRTMANLASDQSAGLEPVLTISRGRTLQANLNGNVFYEQIDASNIGYTARKSVVSWSGTFNVNFVPWSATMLQVTSNYRSARLTPQGTSRPSFVLNAGARQDLYGERFSLTLAVSDLLRTQRQDTRLDVSGIAQRMTNRRDSRVVYAGLTYHYGRPEKSDKKDKAIQYDDQP